MMVTEDVQLERDHLTEEEISLEAPKFDHYRRCLVKYWYRRCKKLIDRDELESDLNLQILRSLRSYRRRQGTTIKTWVDSGMFYMARRSVVLQIQKITKRREVSMYRTSRDDKKTFEINALPYAEADLYEFGVRQAADQISTLLVNQMDERRWSLFYKRYIEGRFLSEMARELGVSQQAVHKSTQNALKHAREIVTSKPEFARYAIYADR